MHRASVVVSGALLGAMAIAGASLAAAQSSTRTVDLAGIWHACSEVGAGYCERWVLAADGRFEARAAQGGCSRLALRRGRWTLRGSILVVSEASRTRWVGGRCEDGELIGASAQTSTHEAPRRQRIRIAECTADERDRSPADCRRFGGTARWRLATDEPTAPTSPDALGPRRR